MPREDLIQYRRGTAAQWAAADPVLAAGEPGYETDTGVFKIGDGATAWSSLSAAFQPEDSDLTAIAALTTTAFGRSLLALADAAALASAHNHSGTYAVYPWTVSVPAVTVPITESGTWTAAQSSSLFFASRYFSNAAQDASVAWDVLLGAGTWTIALLHDTGTDRGIYTVKIDGSSVGTIDGYAASGAAARSSLTGVAVASSGLKRVSLVMSTKNASSTGYRASVSALLFTRTA